MGTAISAVCIAGILYFVGQLGGLVGLDASFQPTLAELLTFGALISATDPVSTLAVFQAKKVDPQLFYLVFGESVLNDAMGLVLFQEFAKLLVPESDQKSVSELAVNFVMNFAWLSLISPILGIVCGVALALLFKHVDMRETVLLELALYVFVLFVPYLLGQLLGLSGIVVILFTGMAARAYVVPNLSEVTAVNADLIFRLLAYLAETAIFLQLGLSVFGLSGSLHVVFVGWALVACLIGRACNIYPLVALHNWTIQRQHGVDPSHHDEVQKLGSTQSSEFSLLLARSTSNTSTSSNLSAKARNRMLYMSVRTPIERGDLKILPNCAHMLWFAGLRGAVAYACVLTFPNLYGHRDGFIMTTMMIVLVTVFCLGATTTPVLEYLDIETNIDEDDYMDSWSTERSMPSFILKIEKFIEQHVVRTEPAYHEALDQVDEDDEADTPSNPSLNADFGGRRSLRSSMRNSWTDDAGLRRSSLSQSMRWAEPSLYDTGREG
jgi:NhaP-type Na+/H+ or K+/H+ antiporter